MAQPALFAKMSFVGEDRSLDLALRRKKLETGPLKLKISKLYGLTQADLPDAQQSIRNLQKK